MERKRAIEVIKKNWPDSSFTLLREALKTLIPELNESEDEMVWLTKYLQEEIDCLRYDIRDYKDSAKLDNLQRALAWVEKQGEYINFRNTAKVGDIITKSEDGVLVNLSQFQRVVKKDEKQELEDNLNKALEKETPESWNKFLDGQGEQKHTDKVGPKFEVGDWVIRNDIVGGACCITQIHEPDYYLTNKHTFISFSEEDKYRLWTIQDAKGSDVLATLGCILIFERFLPKDGGVSYCHYDFGCSKPQFNFNKDDNWYFGKEAKVYPATKEQCDLLFQKMKEAGYEWDAEKKELKKIEDEEYNGEDYGIDGLWNAQRILEKTLGKVDGYQSDDGILEHKCAISAVKKLYEQKHAWSEEDERMLKWLCRIVHSQRLGKVITLKEESKLGEWMDKWLNHNPQNKWRPSKEQMKLLREVQQALLGKDCHNRFVNFMYELKRLREE